MASVIRVDPARRVLAQRYIYVFRTVHYQGVIMKYKLTYRERRGEPTKTIIIYGDFTMTREDVDVGSVGWDSNAGRKELHLVQSGNQFVGYDALSITHVHTVGDPSF